MNGSGTGGGSEPGSLDGVSWADRAVDRSPLVQRSRSRSMQQMKVIVDAAKRLIIAKGATFTTQELVKEAHIAMQTFYRHFPGKDQLLLAVIEDIITEQTRNYEARSAGVQDPVERLRMHVTGALSGIGGDADRLGGPRFITAEHWRLHQLYPTELAQAARPFADLLTREIDAARTAGLLRPGDSERDGELMALFVRSAYHHHAFAAERPPVDSTAAEVWAFFLSALGGRRDAGE